MKKRLRLVSMILLTVVFLTSVTILVRQMIQYRQGEETYSEAEQLAGLPDFTEPMEEPELPADSQSVEKPIYVDPYADALTAMDFGALQEVNEDVLGWILIPGTKVSYPLVQGTDNQYYLNHTWKKWNSSVGAIFLECKNLRDFSQFNTILYGHRMNDGSMFATLKHYQKKSYFESHPSIYITDASGTRKYDVFAAYEVSTQGDTYRIGQKSDEVKQKYIDECLSQALYKTDVVPAIHDRIVTLSTCTGNGHATRWVVQARFKGEAPVDEPSAPSSQAVEQEQGAAPDMPQVQPQTEPVEDSASKVSEDETAASSSSSQTVENPVAMQEPLQEDGG